MKAQVIETTRYDSLMSDAEYFYNGYCRHTASARTMELMGCRAEAAGEWEWAAQYMTAWMQATELALAARRGDAR